MWWAACFAGAFAGTFVVFKNGALGTTSNSVLALVVFGVLVYVLTRTFRPRGRRLAAFAAATAAGLALAETLGAIVDGQWSVGHRLGWPVGLALTGLRGLGLAVLFYIAMVGVLTIARRLPGRVTGVWAPVRGAWRRTRATHWGVGLATWAVLCLSRIPYLLMFYPGVLTNDAINQLGQLLGAWPLSTHHPLAHTLIIKAFVVWGQHLGSLSAGIVLYSVFMILVTCAGFAFALATMVAQRFSRLAVAVVGLSALLMPINGIYSVTMWKDVPFGVALLCSVILLIGAVRDSKAFFSRPAAWAQLIGFSLAVILLRNNGIYVFVATTIVAVACARGFRRQFAIVGAVCLMVFGIFSGPITRAVGAEPGSIREALSIPLQQIARIAKFNPEVLTDADAAYISNVFDGASPQELAEWYNPTKSDPVKNEFSDAWYQDNPVAFYEGWASLALREPRTALSATARNSLGYWYPEACSGSVGGLDVAPNHFGLALDSKAPAAHDAFIASRLMNLRAVPVVSMAYSPGFQCGLVAVAMVILAFKRRYRLLIVAVPLATLWLTCLASPVFAEFRYVYGIFLAAPVVLFLALESPLGAAPHPKRKS
jgi:hypothetical protein